jgi:YbgC/YbaW family acyl-CoA thioester hydrolase
MFSYRKKINFYDCDPAGILFYARVYEICHAAYESMIESFDIGEDYWNSPDYIVPVINSEAFYHRPIKYGEEITIEITVKQLKTTSFELNYLVKNTAGDKCVAVKTVHVFVSKVTMKKVNIVPPVYTGLEKHKIGEDK